MNSCPPLRRLSADHARWLAAMARPASADVGGARLLALWDVEILPHRRAGGGLHPGVGDGKLIEPTGKAFEGFLYWDCVVAERNFDEYAP
jgi:hypothetical protein